MLIVKRFLQIAAIFVLMAIVLAVFVSPAVDLPQTALRAQQLAMLLVISMILAACQILTRDAALITPHSFPEGMAFSPLFSGLGRLTTVLLC
jgi:hypothetical protein